MRQHIAEALILCMFSAAFGLTILNFISIYYDTTIEGLYARFTKAIKDANDE